MFSQVYELGCTLAMHRNFLSELDMVSQKRVAFCCIAAHMALSSLSGNVSQSCCWAKAHKGRHTRRVQLNFFMNLSLCVARKRVCGWFGE